MAFIKSISTEAAEDQELVATYRKSSDLQVLGTLYQRYMDLVYGVCLKYLRDSEMAKDAVMDIFTELTVKLHKYEIGNFRPWLYTLAKNHCLMQLRAKGLPVREIDAEHMQTVEDLHLDDIIEKETSLKRLSACLDTLSADQKRVVELFYLENKCYKDIETLTGIEWNKVRSYIQNGRRNLKICMEKQGKESPSLQIITKK